MTDPIVPTTLDGVLDPAWLSQALGRRIVHTETLEVIRTVATKVRFRAHAENGELLTLCIKGLLDGDEMTRMGGPTMVKEADFYDKVASNVAVRVPTRVRTVIDRAQRQAVLIMRDLIADGARFCSALEPLDADAAAASLGQLAALHAGRDLLARRPWIDRRIDFVAERPHLTEADLQALLDDPRGDPLASATRQAGRLIAALRELASRDAGRPQFLVHGDAHAGNLFVTREGPGLIDWQLLQSGGWALDFTYHVAALLPVDAAARHERTLLAHYLELMRGHGCELPSADEAWTQVREAAVYGFYLWAITRRVDPSITRTFTARLGAAVERHESFALLGA